MIQVMVVHVQGQHYIAIDKDRPSILTKIKSEPYKDQYILM